MAEHRLDEMTWEEVRGLDPSGTIAILPTGATEAHGPHLPLSTDVVIAEAMATAGARELATRGTRTVVLPVLAYTAAPFAEAFPGTVSVHPETIVALVGDIARSLVAQGFRAMAIANSHLDPSHLGALHTAVKVARADFPVAFPDLTRKPWALRLGDEFRSGACHAGRYETSVVMAARAELVRDDIRRGLAGNSASLSVAIGAGKRTFEEAGGPQAYFGAPAEASAAEGEATIEMLGVILAEAVETVVGTGPIAP